MRLVSFIICFLLPVSMMAQHVSGYKVKRDYDGDTIVGYLSENEGDGNTGIVLVNGSDTAKVYSDGTYLIIDPVTGVKIPGLTYRNNDGLVSVYNDRLYVTSIDSITRSFVNDTFYTKPGCYSVDGWIFNGDTIYIDTCSTVGVGFWKSEYGNLTPINSALGVAVYNNVNKIYSSGSGLQIHGSPYDIEFWLGSTKYFEMYDNGSSIKRFSSVYDNRHDLGQSLTEWKDGYFDGKLYTDDLQIDKSSADGYRWTATDASGNGAWEAPEWGRNGTEVYLINAGDFVTFRGESTGTEEVLRWDNTWGGLDYDGYVFSESAGGGNIAVGLKAQSTGSPGVGLHTIKDGTRAFTISNKLINQSLDWYSTKATTESGIDTYLRERKVVRKLDATESDSLAWDDDDVIYRLNVEAHDTVSNAYDDAFMFDVFADGDWGGTYNRKTGVRMWAETDAGTTPEKVFEIGANGSVLIGAKCDQGTRTVNIGRDADATGDYAIAISSVYATSSGQGSTAIGAGWNYASGGYSLSAGGYYNRATGSYSAALGGYHDTVSGSASAVIGGYNINATASNTVYVPQLRVHSSASDYTLIDSNGITLFGSHTTWDDIRVAASSVKVVGASNVPGFEQFQDDGGSSVGVYTYVFSPTTMEQVFFSVQMPHEFNGSIVYPHVHWSPTNSTVGDTVVWALEYTWTNINGTFGTTSTVTGKGATTGDNKHILTALDSIDGSSFSESSMLICRLYRDATDGSDDYAADAAMLEFDIHFEVSQLGGSDNPIPDY